MGRREEAMRRLPCRHYLSEFSPRFCQNRDPARRAVEGRSRPAFAADPAAKSILEVACSADAAG